MKRGEILKTYGAVADTTKNNKKSIFHRTWSGYRVLKLLHKGKLILPCVPRNVKIRDQEGKLHSPRNSATTLLKMKNTLFSNVEHANEAERNCYKELWSTNNIHKYTEPKNSTFQQQYKKPHWSIVFSLSYGTGAEFKGGG